MKKLLVIGAIVFSMAACNRGVQQAAVPSEVVTAFNQRYPDAQNAEWDRENGDYAVEFETRGNRMEAIYAPDGTLLSLEERREGLFGGRAEGEEEVFVPAGVMNSFNQRFPNATDVEWEEDEGEYEVKFKQDNKRNKATYSADGRLMRVKKDR
jgi:uncharacterized membrane protein YkoI